MGAEQQGKPFDGVTGKPDQPISFFVPAGGVLDESLTPQIENSYIDHGIKILVDPIAAGFTEEAKASLAKGRSEYVKKNAFKSTMDFEIPDNQGGCTRYHGDLFFCTRKEGKFGRRVPVLDSLQSYRQSAFVLDREQAEGLALRVEPITLAIEFTPNTETPVSSVTVSWRSQYKQASGTQRSLLDADGSNNQLSDFIESCYITNDRSIHYRGSNFYSTYASLRYELQGENTPFLTLVQGVSDSVTKMELSARYVFDGEQYGQDDLNDFKIRYTGFTRGEQRKMEERYNNLGLILPDTISSKKYLNFLQSTFHLMPKSSRV